MAQLRFLTVVFAVIMFTLPAWAGQADNNPPDNNDGTATKKHKKNKEVPAEANPPDNNDPNAQAGGRGGPGQFNPQGLGNMISNFLGGHGIQLGGNMGDNVEAIASRQAGVELDNKTNAKVDALPLGANRSFVLNVPVGGVDSYSLNLHGFKMETVFKLTDEQTKAVADLRDEYKNEQKKLEAEIVAQQKALAEQALKLRLKYEQRANDILTGADKETKQKLDALAQDTNAKAFTAATGTLADYDNPDFTKIRQIIAEIRQTTGKLFEDAQAKVLELLPPGGKAFVEAAFKELQAQQQQNPWQGQGGPGGVRGRRGGNANQPGDAVKPPQPPATNNQF